MTVSRIIRGDSPGAIVSRWTLPNVGPVQEDQEPVECEPQKSEEVETPPVALPTPEEIEALKKQAYDEAYTRGLMEGRQIGLEEGRSEGYKAGEMQAQELVRQMRDVLDCLSAPLAQLDDEVEQQLLELSLVLARQIIRRELQTQPGEVVAVVREALALLPVGSRDVTVHLHPDDAQFVREALAPNEEGGNWRIVEDAALSRGGCRVESSASHIDATLERRLAVLARDLLGGSRGEDAAEVQP